MESQRVSVRNNLQFYQGEFVKRVVLGCFKQTCYVILKKGTIYIYNSKKSCLDNPEKPIHFFNLNVSKITRNGHYLYLQGPFSKYTLWNIREEDASTLEDYANYNKTNLNVQKIFPKKFIDLNSRIDEKLQWEKSKG